MFQEDQSVKTTLSRAFTKDLSAIIPGFYAAKLNTVARTPQPKVMSYICSLEEEPGGGEETGA